MNLRARTVCALNLHVGDIVIPDHGPRRRVTLHRLQGAHPVVVVQYEGIPGASTLYPPSMPILIECDDDARQATGSVTDDDDRDRCPPTTSTLGRRHLHHRSRHRPVDPSPRRHLCLPGPTVDPVNARWLLDRLRLHPRPSRCTRLAPRSVWSGRSASDSDW